MRFCPIFYVKRQIIMLELIFTIKKPALDAEFLKLWWGRIVRVLTIYKGDIRKRLADICNFDGIIS